MDADLATPIEELDALVARARRGRRGGDRLARRARRPTCRRSQSTLRVLLGRAGNLWIRSLAVPGVHDTQCGFKLFDGESGAGCSARCRVKIASASTSRCCAWRAARFGLRIAEVGVRWEHQDGSKVRLKDYVDVFVKVPRIVWSVLRAEE